MFKTLLKYNRNDKTQGFTLIEILVVLVIAGIIISFVIVNSPRFIQDYYTKQEAQKIAGILAFTREYAILQDTKIKLEFHNQNYQFWYQQEDQWHKIDNHRLLKPSSIDSEYRLQPVQTIIFSPSGEFTEFQLSFLNKAQESIVIL